MKHLISIIKILFINGILLLGLLYIFEFFFSPYADMPKNERTVTGEQYTWGHKVRSNSWGYRGPEVPPKPDDVYRILVLGDSLTWGVGLTEDQRFTHIAEQKLSQMLPDKKFEVINFGFPGYPTVTERDELYKHYDDVKPDLIVVGFCLNDPQPKGQNDSIEREKYKNALPGKLVTFLQKVFYRLGLPYVSKLVGQLYYQPLVNSGKIPKWQDALQRTYETDSKEWQGFITALQDIKKISDQHGLPTPIFAILNQGTYNDKPTHYSKPDKELQRFLAWYKQAEAAANSVGFNSYNHVDEIINQLDDQILSVNQYDAHPSAALNKIYGEKLADKVAATLKATGNK